MNILSFCLIHPPYWYRFPPWNILSLHSLLHLTNYSTHPHSSPSLTITIPALSQARDLLRQCWNMNQSLLCALYPVLATCDRQHPTDIFFLSTILVVPNQFRACNFRNGAAIEHQQTVILRVSLSVCVLGCMDIVVEYRI